VIPDIPKDRDNCPVEATLRLIGGKWRMFVLFRLGEGPMRFNALQRSLAPITQRVLTATLRGLEDDGLVWRAVRETVPPHVDYGLTDRGEALAPVWAAMARWQIEASGR
jgi:DNA-binding HxlR family transcriptional regulator